MAYIYCITNKINGKQYIGKTTKANPIERFREHIIEGRFHRLDKGRALLRAIRKYGEENFEFNVIEECSETEASDREMYYIRLYGTYHNGYNETLGGDGTLRIDYDEAVKEYFKTCNIPAASDALNINPRSLKNILLSRGVKPLSIYKTSSPVIGYTDNIQYLFESVRGAAKYIYYLAHGINHFPFDDTEHSSIVNGVNSHIRRAMETGGTAYKFYWKRSDISTAANYLKIIQLDLKEPQRIFIDKSIIRIDISNIEFNNIEFN